MSFEGQDNMEGQGTECGSKTTSAKAIGFYWLCFALVEVGLSILEPLMDI